MADIILLDYETGTVHIIGDVPESGAAIEQCPWYKESRFNWMTIKLDGSHFMEHTWEGIKDELK